MNTINWTPKAAKQLRKLPGAMQVNIRDEVQAKLSVFPECQGIKRLTDHDYRYRLRVGNYRVFFDFDRRVKIILIEEVKKRNEHTY
jgi:mRNA-degrading endonuclease RelE of RelBE toxin-antitoxin system